MDQAGARNKLRRPSCNGERQISVSAWTLRLRADAMSEELDTAKRYRLRAEELKIIADDESGLQTRLTLRKIAEDYERMAETLEAIDRTNRAIARPRSPL